MWKDLSMQQRADLMDIYLSHGVTSLDEMRRHYDSRDIGTANAYREGGDIFIKPENRGKFTALKERTGHSATWFKEHGTPAQKKMAVFALNSRHWKHGLGGNLFDGISQPSQQMDRPNIFRYNDGRYVYQAAPDAEEIEVSPINTLLPDPSQWTYQDASGKIYTPHAAQIDTGSVIQDEERNPLVRAANNYFREAAYRAKDGTLALQGKYTMPAIAASALLPLAGEAAYPLLTNPYVDATITSGFGAHGLNHAINEGIDGWGDAAMTALEVAPLGRLARPMWNEAALAIENYRYPLGRPQVPEGYLTVKPQVRTRIGDVEIDNPQLFYRQGSAEMGDDFIKSGVVRTSGGFENPMYTEGALFKKVPTRTKGGLSKGDKIALEGPYSKTKSDLLVTDSSVDMIPADQGSGKNYTWFEDYMLDPFAEESLFDKSRVPLFDGTATSANTTVYRWEPGYGYRRIRAEETPAAEWADATRTSQITAENAATIQRQIGKTAPSGSLEETANAVESGRNALLDWIRSPFYKARLEDEPLYRVSDDVVADAGKMIEEVPIDISKTKLELDPSGMVNGTTKTRPAIQTQLPDGTILADLNTGLDVSVASDLGKDADETALHELLHYMTANSKGEPISKAGERIVSKGWMNPTETHFDAINIMHKNRSKSWQDYIMDQNESLLPQYDPVVKMVMEEPDKAVSFLKQAGRTESDAKSAVQSLRTRYSEWYDIQEQRAYLQQLFHSKIRPNLKNPNDATEIEQYLTQHPEILDNFPAYKYIQEVRPGSIKDYAKYFSAALGTIPFISKPSKDE